MNPSLQRGYMTLDAVFGKFAEFTDLTVGIIGLGYVLSLIHI